MARYNFLPVCCVALSLFVCWVSSSAAAASASACVSAVFSFGDSSSDVGNWALSGSTTLPYGGYGNVLPTSGRGGGGGRFSNGRLLIDFITEELGLPPLSPSLDQAADFSHGASFSVAGATLLPTDLLASELPASSFATTASLGVQVERYQQLVASRCSADGCKEEEYVREALFVVDGMGASDMFYAMTLGGKSLSQMREEYLPRMLHHLGQAIEGLIQAGARKLLILGPTRIGCLPLFARQPASGGTPAAGCNHEMQALAEDLEQKMREGLVQLLQWRHPDVFMLYFVQSIAEVLVINGDVPELAATTGHQFQAHPLEPCYDPTHSKLCQDPDHYVFWDALHTTEAFQRSLAYFFLAGGYHGILLNHPVALLGTVGDVVSTPTKTLRLSLGCDSSLVQGPLATLQASYRTDEGM